MNFHQSNSSSALKKLKNPTNRSEGDHKVNHNSTSDQIEGANYCSPETNLSPQREHVGAINQHNNNPSSSMAREGDNYNDEYYVPIKNGSGRGIVEPNIFR